MTIRVWGNEMVDYKKYAHLGGGYLLMTAGILSILALESATSQGYALTLISVGFVLGLLACLISEKVHERD